MVNSGNCLFRVTKLTTNYDPNKYGYSGCGIESDVRSNFSWDSEWSKNVVILGDDNSSSVYAYNRKDISLFLVKIQYKD